MAGRSRDLRIDTARALACFLLVAYHVIGASDSSGLRLPDTHALREFNDALGLVRMPLFTILSGMVYALRPVSWDRSGLFVQGKALRLLLPLVFVGYLFAIVQMLTPGANEALTPRALLFLPFFSYAHFWFLQALFLVFLFLLPFEASGFSQRRAGMAMLLALATVLFLARDQLPHVFSADRAAYLLPFFLAGVALRRFSASIYRLGRTAAVLVGVPAVVALAAVAAGQAELAWHCLRLALGVGFASLLLAIVPPVRFLAEIGHYSYTIYLFHVFFAAASRIVLGKLGVESLAILTLSGIVAGVTGPIVVHRSLERVPYLSRMFLGLKTRPRRVPPPTEPLSQQRA
jgi:glucans biosynthesis protein C